MVHIWMVNEERIKQTTTTATTKSREMREKKSGAATKGPKHTIKYKYWTPEADVKIVCSHFIMVSKKPIGISKKTARIERFDYMSLLHIIISFDMPRWWLWLAIWRKEYKMQVCISSSALRCCNCWRMDLTVCVCVFLVCVFCLTCWLRDFMLALAHCCVSVCVWYVCVRALYRIFVCVLCVCVCVCKCMLVECYAGAVLCLCQDNEAHHIPGIIYFRFFRWTIVLSTNDHIHFKMNTQLKISNQIKLKKCDTESFDKKAKIKTLEFIVHVSHRLFTYLFFMDMITSFSIFLFFLGVGGGGRGKICTFRMMKIWIVYWFRLIEYLRLCVGKHKYIWYLFFFWKMNKA